VIRNLGWGAPEDSIRNTLARTADAWALGLAVTSQRCAVPTEGILRPIDNLFYPST
jgi:hypothetical protein